LRFLSVEPLLESVADIDLTGIGWVAVGWMSGPLHTTRKMDLKWAAEVHDLCRAQRIPFLFEQASNDYTERGINALSLYLAERARQEVDPETVPLIPRVPKDRTASHAFHRAWEAIHHEGIQSLSEWRVPKHVVEPEVA